MGYFGCVLEGNETVTVKAFFSIIEFDKLWLFPMGKYMYKHLSLLSRSPMFSVSVGFFKRICFRLRLSMYIISPWVMLSCIYLLFIFVIICMLTVLVNVFRVNTHLLKSISFVYRLVLLVYIVRPTIPWKYGQIRCLQTNITSDISWDNGQCQIVLTILKFYC